MGHLNRNKKLYGAVMTGVAAGLAAYGLQEAATAVGMLGAFLFGAGAMKSDAEVKAGN